MTSRTCALLVTLLPITALFLISVGCEGVKNTYDPVLPAGRIEGRVRTAGLPVDATIIGKRYADGVYTGTEIQVQPDSSGLYSMDVPQGDYVVALDLDDPDGWYRYAGSVLSYGQVPPETVRVDDRRSTLTIDFDLGAMVFDLELAHAFDGQDVGVRLYRSDMDPDFHSYNLVDYAEVEVEDGRAYCPVPGVMPGLYQVEVIIAGSNRYADDGERFWWPDRSDPMDSPWIEVGLDSVVVLSTSLPAEAARLEGRVYGAWLDLGLEQKPEISVVGLDSSIIRSSLEVDDEGRFGFALQLPNSVKLRVEQDGIEQWIGGPGFDEATVYSAQPGETISSIDLIQCGLQVRVESSDPEFGRPTFQLYDSLDQSLLVSVRSNTHNDRNIGIANLWPGEYLVEITPGRNSLGSVSWLPQWFDRAATMEEGQIVVLGGAGDIVTLEVVLERGGVISGRVESASGELDYHYMVLTPGDEYVSWARRWHGRDAAAFMLSGLPDGQYKVGFVSTAIAWNFPGPPPAETTWYPGTQDWDEATILTIEDASEVTGIDFEVP